MRVAVRITIDVDPDEYRAEYDEQLTAEEIRAMVKTDATEAVRGYAERFDWARSVKEG